MRTSIESVHLGQLKVLVPVVFEDERGFFMETYRADELARLGLPAGFVQDNHSRSAKEFAREIFRLSQTPIGLRRARPAYSVLASGRLAALGLDVLRPWQAGLARHLGLGVHA